tara:strand:- start:214 stop:420 length:207 start_codon:yes stop_codon:yes gene_type:complete
MPTEISILICSALIFLISPVLIMLNHIRVKAEKKSNIIDYQEYVRQKSNGDEIDKLIANQLDINDIAA